MRQGALEGTLPAFPTVVQVGSPPGKLASWIHLHSLGSTYQTDEPAFGQNFSAAYTGPLGHMFHTLNRFLRHLHLTSLPRLPHLHQVQVSARLQKATTATNYTTKLPLFTKVIAALVFLTAYDFATFFVKLQLDTFLLALLALLLVAGFIIFLTGRLEDLRLHLEELIQ